MYMYNPNPDPTRPGTIRKFKLEYYYSNTTIRKKPMVFNGKH